MPPKKSSLTPAQNSISRSSRRSSKTTVQKPSARASSQSTAKPISARQIRSTHVPAFLTHLVIHGIYPPDHDLDRNGPLRPANYDTLLQVIKQERQTHIITESDYHQFSREAQRTIVEKGLQLMPSAFKLISPDSMFLTMPDIIFDNLELLTNNLIPRPKPDYYDGARLLDLDLQVLDEINTFVVPSVTNTYPIVPNFLIEAKGPKGNHHTATQQAMYWGAVGARAMLHLQWYKRKKDFDNNAYAIVCKFTPTNLKIYSSHPSRNDDKNRIEYHTTHLYSFCLDNSDTFRDAMRGWLNIREWAQQKRDEFIQAANARVGTDDSDGTSWQGFSDDEMVGGGGGG
jgi:hypothetical protein